MSSPPSRDFLSLLGNPMLNQLFNNPIISKNPKLKAIVDTLAQRPGDYVLLIPQTKFLLLGIDQDTGLPYKELCMGPEFIQAHIVNIKWKKQTEPGVKRVPRQYTTMNERQIRIRKNIIENIDGYKHDFSVHILRQEVFRTFCNYVPFATCFHVMIVEEALTGNPKYRGLRDVASPVSSSESSVSTAMSKTCDVSFDQILNEMPAVSNRLGDPFKKLFDDYNVKKCTTLKQLSDSFTDIMAKGSSIVNVLSDVVCNAIFARYPHIDLRRALYNYIEMNIHDKLWPRYLTILNNDNDRKIKAAYPKLEHLSITQVGIPEKCLEDPAKLGSLEKRVLAAISEFKKLAFASTSEEQTSILCETFRTLSHNDDSIDADSLIALTILVVAHAAVPNLNAHLSYIRSYSFSDDLLEGGFEGYSISSFEAVLSFYDDPAMLAQLCTCSHENNEFWSLLKSVSSDSNEQNSLNDSSNDASILKKVHELLDPYSDGDIGDGSFIRSRTLQGESCLMIALFTNNYKLFKLILDYTNIFTLDDILEDQNVQGLNLLNAALQLKHKACEEIAQIILQADHDEIRQYCNTTDDKLRNVGHFLFHCSDLIPLFGPYIDWKAKDVTGKTPLFAIIRCYDHPSYDHLIEVSIEAVVNWYEANGCHFDFRDHIDNRGNTVLHAVRDGDNLRLLLDKFECLDLNYLNDSEQTALVQFIRYNRLSNVQAIVDDSRIDLWRTDSKYQLTAQDYVKVNKVADEADSNEQTNKQIMDLLDREYLDRFSVGLDGNAGFYALRIKFDVTHSMCIYINSRDANGDTYTVVHSYTDFFKLMHLLKMRYPSTYIGTNNREWLPDLYNINERVHFNYSKKFRLNGLLTNINMLLRCVSLNPTLANSKLVKDFMTLNKPLNEVQCLKDIKQYQEESRRHHLESSGKTNYLLQPADIASYKTFLNFSNEDLKRLSKALDKWYRISAYAAIKWCDLADVQDNLVYMTANTGRPAEVPKMLDQLPYEMLVTVTEQHREIHGSAVQSGTTFEESLKFVRNSVSELSANINQFVQVKVGSWWQLYGEIKQIGDDISRVLSSERSTNRHNSKNVAGPTILDQTLMEIGAFIGTVDPEEAKKLEGGKPTGTLFETSGGYLSGIIEKRRKEYTDKLLERFNKLKNRMVLLNIDLKCEYEQLCMEVSNLYKFREVFLRKTLKQLAWEQLQTHKLQKGLMENNLSKLQRGLY